MTESPGSGAPTSVTYHEACHLRRELGATTQARQLLVSGIYIALVETPEGDRVFRKFTVIR